jgi:hypothetical protein
MVQEELPQFYGRIREPEGLPDYGVELLFLPPKARKDHGRRGGWGIYLATVNSMVKVGRKRTKNWTG